MPQDLTDYYIRKARRSGKVEIIMGKKHIKMRANDPTTGQPSTMMMPRELKAKGTEHAIRKWLIRMGVLLSLLGVLWRIIPSV